MFNSNNSVIVFLQFKYKSYFCTETKLKLIIFLKIINMATVPLISWQHQFKNKMFLTKKIIKYTIDGSVVFLHSQYSCILTSQVSNQFYVSDKIINNSDNFRIKSLSFSEKELFFFVLFIFWFYTFLFNLRKHVN